MNRERIMELMAESSGKTVDDVRSFIEGRGDPEEGWVKMERLVELIQAEPLFKDPDDRPFQVRLGDWVTECFGAEVGADKRIRNHRFFEEATELVQAAKMTRYEAHALVDEIYSRAPGDLRQEVGGVMTTLAALCNAHDINMVGAAEIAPVLATVQCDTDQRVAGPHGVVARPACVLGTWQRIPKIRERQATKLNPIPGDPPIGGFAIIDYTNYKGERYSRTIVPHYLFYGTSPHHPDKQWLLKAVDIEKGPRTYAMRDIHAWRIHY